MLNGMKKRNYVNCILKKLYVLCKLYIKKSAILLERRYFTAFIENPIPS